jgi:hypothetical protein
MATLLIHSIACVAVSDSKLTPEARAAINTTIDFASTVATTAGGYGALVAGALQAGKAIFNAIGDLGGAPDQLYLSLSNSQRQRKIWPKNTEYYEVNSGQIIRELGTKIVTIPLPFPVNVEVPSVGPLSLEFSNAVDVNFWEWDKSPDDFMGRLTVSEDDVGRMKVQVVGNVEAGDLYTVVYSVEAPRWASLQGHLNSDLASVKTLNGELAVFGRGGDQQLWWRKQINANGKWDGDWRPLGGILMSGPAVTLNADGAIVVFVQGADNALYYRQQLARDSANWSEWESLGGSMTSGPAVLLDSNGCLAVFARGTNGEVRVKWQTRPNAEWTASWSSLGGVIIGAPAVCLDARGHAVLVVRGTDGAVWMNIQERKYRALGPNEGHFAGKGPLTFGIWPDEWKSLDGQVTSTPAVFQNADGGLVVFARGADGSAWHRWQAHEGANWSNTWDPLFGSFLGALTATRTDDGRLEIFGVGLNNEVLHRWQTTRNGAWF